MAGGSNTRLFDDNDRARDGDSDQGQYPQFVTNADGKPTVVLNTDGSYKYVGRLVIDFDANGDIIADSYDETVSGAFATDDQGVADLGAEGLIDPEIQAIADAIETQVLATEGNVFGVSEVFLNGNRNGVDTATDPDGVRSQETNLGNLTADANLAAAQNADSTVLVSIKNGGGIRASIGETVVPPGGSDYLRQPNSEIRDGDGNVVKPEGGVSQTDIQASLAFNNELSLLTLTRAELVDVLEHAVGDVGGGRFPQISRMAFGYDATQPAGDRIVNAAIIDPATDQVIAELVRDGEMFDDPNQTFRIVTLNYLAGGGDGYPFPTGSSANRVDLTDLNGDGVDDDSFNGAGTFAADGTEQDALAEYLNDSFNPDNGGAAFNEADAGRDTDSRIVNLACGVDNVIGQTLIGDELVNTLTGGVRNDTLIGLGEADVLDGGDGSDWVDYSASNSVVVDLAAGAGALNDAAGDTLISIENVIDSHRGDTITGDANDNRLLAGRGNDTVDGGAGADFIDGGFGKDTLIGGDGDDFIEVGKGDDIIDGGDGGSIRVNLSITTAQDLGAAGVDTIIGFENVDGGAINDVIIGTVRDNVLRGLDLNDTLIGLGGDDTLRGDDGFDSLQGGTGVDILIGGASRDFLRGDSVGRSADFADRFVYLSASDSSALAADRDVIDDFAKGVDMVDLSAIDANTNTIADDAFMFIGHNAGFTGQAGELRSRSISGDREILEADLDGDQVADFGIQFNNFASDLDANDFVL